MDRGCVGDMMELGVTESFQVKRQVLISASEAAEMILRVDDIIKAAPRWERKGRGKVGSKRIPVKEREEKRCVGESEELEHSRHEPYWWSHAWEWRTFYFSLHTGKGHLIIATEEQLQCIPRTQSLVVHISMYIYCIDLCLSPSFHCLLYEKLELRSLVSFCAIKKTILSGLDASLIPRLQPNFCHCAKNITKAGKKSQNETGSEPWNQIG